MKNVIQSVCIALAAILMAWSCKKDDSPELPPEGEAVAVKFSSNIGNLASLVKSSAIKPAAAGSTWAGNDAIGVFMVNHGVSDVRNEAVNKRYVTAAGDGNFAPDAEGSTVYYPVNGDKVDFIAYYPYVSSISTLGAYNVNVSDQSVPAAIDLLYAKATGTGGYDQTNTSPVALSFSHRLSKLTLNIPAPAASTQITAADLLSMTVSIAGLNTQAQFNLAGGTLGTASAPAAITPFTVTVGAKYEAILLPGDFSGVSVTFGITDGNNPGDYVWNVPDEAFEAGKEYVYSVSFTGAPGEVSVTGVINPWEIVTPEIPLTEPADGAYMSANLVTFPVRFSWTEAPGVVNYKLKFSPLNDFDTPGAFQEIAVSGDHYDLIATNCENMLAATGINPNETIDLYWTVVPATAAEVRTYTRRITARRAGSPAQLPTTGWVVTSDATTEGALANLIDGDLATYWNGSNASAWGGVCWIMIDMKEVKKLTGISLHERIGYTYNTKVYTSISEANPSGDPAEDANKTYLTEWTMNSPIEYTSTFPEITARYIYIYPRIYAGGEPTASFFEVTLTGLE